MRSTGAIVLLVIFLVVGFAGCLGCGTYNSLVQKDEAVATAWANVETTYQRRADLIPNLVSTVQGAADFESETLQAVTEARTRAVNITLSAEDLADPAAVQNFMDAQQSLGAATGALINAVREDYPELGATENFLALQDQLEGTENRINVARRDYNGAVGDRKLFIATGYGAEAVVTDAVAGRIIRNVIAPHFREGRYYAGIDEATDAIAAAAAGEFSVADRAPGAANGSDIVLVFIVLLVLLVVVFIIAANSKGGGPFGGGSGWIVVPGGRGGWTGGGGSFGGGFSGGFGGFGGGGFGGGGAGGGW